MKSFSEYDAAFKDAFMDNYNEAQVPRGRSNIVPPGIYNVVIRSVELTDRNNIRAASIKRLPPEKTYANTLEVVCAIMGGDYEGIEIPIRVGICLGNVRLLKQTLLAIGYELHGLDKLEADIESHWADGLVCVGVVTKKKTATGYYTNLWLQRPVERQTDGDSDEMTDGGDTPWMQEE